MNQNSVPPAVTGRGAGPSASRSRPSNLKKVADASATSPSGVRGDFRRMVATRAPYGRNTGKGSQGEGRRKSRKRGIELHEADGWEGARLGSGKDRGIGGLGLQPEPHAADALLTT